MARPLQRIAYAVKCHYLMMSVLTLAVAMHGAFPASGAETPDDESKKDGVLEGVVLDGGSGRSGILVEVHLRPRKEGPSSAVAAVTTDPDGGFALHLAPGVYYLTVREPAAPPRPPRILEYGGNPVTVDAGKTLTVEAFHLEDAGPGEGGGTLVSGRLLFGGDPVPGATVMIYPAGKGRPVGPAYSASATSGPEGGFSLAAKPGTYDLVARKRMRGTAFGPPQPGDLSAEYGGNPVAVGGEDLEIGDLEMHEVDLDRLRGRLRELDAPEKTATAVRGRVYDTEGKAVADMFVFLYGHAGMTGKPLVVTRSDAEGRFVLSAPGGGDYFVIARSRYGTASQPGDFIGLVDSSRDSSLTVKEGSIRDGVVLILEQRW